MTFTTPHTLNSTLGLEIDQFAVAWRRFQKGKQSDRLRKNSFGNHVGRECTWGARNGWHYHQHQLRYDLPGTFDEHRARAQWLNALDSVGRLWRGAELHAFDAGLIGDEAGARYIAKVATSVEAQGRAIGSEIASAATKGNNLATLLKRGLEGDSEASETWFSGVSDIITRKVSSVRWSRGLREKVGMSAEKSDEEIAQEEALPSDVFLGALTAAQWSGILRARCEFTLCVAANSGEDAVNELLANLNLGRLNDDAAPAVHVSLAADNVYRGITPVIK